MDSAKLAPRKRHQWTPKKRAEFIHALAQGATAVSAANFVGMSRSGAYRLRDTDPDFAEAWREAYKASTELLEAEAYQRAVGRDEVVGVNKDGQPIVVRKYSDLLLIFLLKARRPDVYRERANVSPQVDTSVVINLVPVEKDPHRPGQLRVVERD